MSEKSAKSFLSLLQKSGIVQEDRLKTVLSDLSKRAAGRKVNLSELSKHLIQSGVVTSWHLEKLLSGKYKGFFLGKYKLLGHLGTGGMSSVYLGEHVITGHKRALKVLPKKKVDDKSYFDRFYREGRAAASLNDPNVVRVYDICGEGSTHYMVMEYVEGHDLYEIVNENGPLDFEQALEYTAQAAKGLQHAHDMKLVHRDVKPANLLVSGKTVKILDLGLALLTEDEESLTVLHNEKVMGTADYLAPEQAVNSHEVDHRADIYGLGCTLYFLLTGHPPFPKGTLAQRIAMHQSKEPEEITVDRPDCPSEIVAICKMMMKKGPDQRISSCREVIQAINACRQKVAAATTMVTGGSGDPGSSNVIDEPSVSESPGPTSSIRSSADIRTDEIAAGNTVGLTSSPAKPSADKPAKKAAKKTAASKAKPTSKRPTSSSADAKGKSAASKQSPSAKKPVAKETVAKNQATAASKQAPTKPVAKPAVTESTSATKDSGTPVQKTNPVSSSDSKPVKDSQAGKPVSTKQPKASSSGKDRPANSTSNVPRVEIVTGDNTLADGVAPPKKIKTRQTSGRKKNSTAIWIGVMVGLMFVLLLIVVLFAMQFAAGSDSSEEESRSLERTQSSPVLVLKAPSWRTIL